MQMRHCSWVLMLAAVFAIAFASITLQAQSFTVLHTFQGSDGSGPIGALTLDGAGNIYGTTFNGGSFTDGVVFKIDTNGIEAVLLNFNGSNNGASPDSGLILDPLGNLYGPADGPPGSGVLFELSPAGNERLLFVFQGGSGSNPGVPEGALLKDPRNPVGYFWGTTLAGGDGNCEFGCGTIFELLGLGGVNDLKVLYQFSGGADGGTPVGPLIRDASGNLYGTALTGGDLACPQKPVLGCGTVFKLAPNGSLTVLHTFSGGSDGAGPQPGLLMDGTGDLFGTAEIGGSSNCDLGCGVIYEISAGGEFSLLYSFTGAVDGNYPNGGLVGDSQGDLYGTTATGTTNSLYGTVYELTSSGTLRVLHSLNGFSDGATPQSGLVRDSAGNLYGTAFNGFGQDDRNGTVFKVVP